MSHSGPDVMSLVHRLETKGAFSQNLNLRNDLPEETRAADGRLVEMLSVHDSTGGVGQRSPSLIITDHTYVIMVKSAVNFPHAPPRSQEVTSSVIRRHLTFNDQTKSK